MLKRTIPLIVFLLVALPAAEAQLKYTKTLRPDYNQCAPPESIRSHARKREFNTACMEELDFYRCRYMSNEYEKGQCYTIAARRRNDKMICENISRLSDRYLCIAEIAENTQDAYGCYEIPDQYQTSKGMQTQAELKERCYRSIQDLNPRYNLLMRNIKSYIELDSPDDIVESICKKDIHPKRDLVVLKNLNLQQCGDFFRLSMLDEPHQATLLDVNGRKIAACRRIQYPDGTSQWGRDQRCTILCDEVNLCDGIVIDCAVFDLPEDIPRDFQGQVLYFQKKMMYEYTRQSAQAIMEKCETVNAARRN